jgi:hypothetical protein
LVCSQPLGRTKRQTPKHRLSRFARWASLRQIDPKDIDDAAIERFVAELRSGTLIRQIRDQHRRVAVVWNRLAAIENDGELRVVRVPSGKPAPTRVAWDELLARKEPAPMDRCWPDLNQNQPLTN